MYILVHFLANSFRLASKTIRSLEPPASVPVNEIPPCIFINCKFVFLICCTNLLLFKSSDSLSEIIFENSFFVCSLKQFFLKIGNRQHRYPFVCKKFGGGQYNHFFYFVQQFSRKSLIFFLTKYRVAAWAVLQAKGMELSTMHVILPFI